MPLVQEIQRNIDKFARIATTDYAEEHKRGFCEWAQRIFKDLGGLFEFPLDVKYRIGGGHDVYIAFSRDMPNYPISFYALKKKVKETPTPGKIIETLSQTVKDKHELGISHYDFNLDKILNITEILVPYEPNLMELVQDKKVIRFEVLDEWSNLIWQSPDYSNLPHCKYSAFDSSVPFSREESILYILRWSWLGKPVISTKKDSFLSNELAYLFEYFGLTPKS